MTENDNLMEALRHIFRFALQIKMRHVTLCSIMVWQNGVIWNDDLQLDRADYMKIPSKRLNTHMREKHGGFIWDDPNKPTDKTSKII